MATKIGMLVAAISFVFLALFMAPSRAAIMNAYSITYFDTSNHVIGQEMTYCNNVSKYAGTIDRRNPNYIRQEYGCGDVAITCGDVTFHSGPDHGGYFATVCTPAGQNYGSWITYFHSATGLTQNDYCNRSTIDGPFAYGPPCGYAGLSQIPGFGVYHNGFPPSN